MDIDIAQHKRNEIGTFPDDWDAKPLSLVATLNVGYAFKSAWFRTSDGIPLLRGENVGYGHPDWSDTRLLDHDSAKSFRQYELKPGDIVIGMDRTFTKSGSKISLLREQDCPCLLVQRVGKFIASNCAPSFLWAILSSTPYKSALQLEEKGMDIPHLSRIEILKPIVAIPPTLAEQMAIAEALEDADALIESLEELIAKKQLLKQASMQELLTGKRRLPGFDGDWDLRKFGSFFSFSGGLSASRDQLSNSGHCYLHYGDIHGSNRTYVDVQVDSQCIPKLDVNLSKVSSSSLLSDGDVVFVDASEDVEGASRHIVVVNPTGIPFISGLHTIVAKSKTDEVENSFRRYCFQSAPVKQQFRFFAVGTKVSSVSKSNIAKIEIKIPSRAEQLAIASILVDMDAEIEALEARLAKARLIKQAMMQELLTGKIRLV